MISISAVTLRGPNFDPRGWLAMTKSVISRKPTRVTTMTRRATEIRSAPWRSFAYFRTRVLSMIIYVEKVGARAFTLGACRARIRPRFFPAFPRVTRLTREE